MRDRSRRVLWPTLAVLLLMALGSCSVHRHRVGAGPSGIGSETRRQFYVFFGWLPLNDCDTQRITADMSSYEIVTEWSFTDFLLAPLLLPFTCTSRTVTVYK
jgi:hypothetical protein